MPQAAMVIGAVAGVAGTVIQYTQGRKIAKAQQQQQEAATRKERLQAIRATMIQGAQAQAGAVGAGVADSSGAIGGIGALRSQLGTEMGFSSQMSELSHRISGAQQMAAFGGAMSDLGWTAYSWGDSRRTSGASVPAPAGYQPPNSSGSRMNLGTSIYGSTAYQA